MKYHILIFLLCFSINHCAISTQLITSMKEEAAKIASEMPTGYSSLVTNIQSNQINDFDSSSIADFDTMITKYNFPSQIVNQFKMVIISESIEFQTFQVELQNTYSDIQEFIGAASNYNGIINVAFLQVYSEGTPLPQYESYKCCHRCHLFGKCCDTCQREISMNQQQMETVTEALRASAYQNTMNFLNNPSDKFGNYSKQQQQLDDENSWDELMTQQDQCAIDEDSPCASLFIAAYQECSQKYQQTDYDDITACAIQYVQLNTYWKPCFLCLCSQFFYDTKLSLTKTNEACFYKYYPNDK